MGASASVNQDRVVKKPVQAHNVRQRLHSEYGGDNLVEAASKENGPSGLRITEVPAVLKARGAFLRKLKGRRQTRPEGTNIVQKQVRPQLIYVV